VLRAAGQTEATQENIQDWLELDLGEPGFQLLVFVWFLNNGSTMTFVFIYFHRHCLCYYIFHLLVF
jgi:hypothetical protein